MSNYIFTERGPLEAGFEKVFHDRIVPILERNETRRKAAYRTLMLGLAVCGAAAVGIIVHAIVTEAMDYVVLVFAALIVAIVWSNWRTNKWDANASAELLPVMCDFLGNMSYGNQRIRLDNFQRLGLVPSTSNFNLGGSKSIALEDPIVGVHDGLNWSLAEAVITSKSGDSHSESHELLFEMEIDGDAPQIFFQMNMGKTLNALTELFSSQRKGMDRIETGNARFDKLYATYSPDPTAALNYIDFNLTEGLILVAEAETGSNAVVCAIEGDTLYLALDRNSDFLSVGSIGTPFNMVEDDLHAALVDLDLPRRVLDQLRGK